MRNVKIVTDETYLMIIVSDFFIFKFNLEYKRKLSVKNELKFTDRLVCNQKSSDKKSELLFQY